MKFRIPIVLLGVIVLLICSTSHAVSKLQLVPEQQGNQLFITFPTNGIRWMISIADDKVYPSEYGQKLSLNKNQEIILRDRHISHKIKAIIQDDKTGLEVTTKEDLRSFGKNVTEEKYFISIKNRPTSG